ncbi:hypothetical protein ACS0TY_008162 [Phlomoides rotata]
MALQKRLDYGFNGYQVPPTPRAARSARKRCLVKRKADDYQMCAFDLLATVAGKLLLDGESSPPSANASSGKEHPEGSARKEEKDADKPLEDKAHDRDCYERNFMFTELVSEAHIPNSCSNEHACTQNDVISRPASGITSSDCSEKFGSGEQLDDCNLRLGIFPPSVDIESSGFRVSANSGSEDESRKDVKKDSANIRNNLSISNKASLFSSEHPEAPGRKSSALVCSVDSVKFPFCRDHSPCGSLPAKRENVKLVTRDDDDNSSECVEPMTRNKVFKPSGDRKFRKLLASKHCKTTSNVKDDEHYNAERFNYLNRKNGFKRQGSLRDYPFKKRKLYDYSSFSNSDESINGDEICRTSENGINGSGPTQPAANPPQASVAGGYASFHSRNNQVKLKIKSFKVPDLYIEIPETATVGSLKKSVMEAVNSVLGGGGLRVGVLLQGKRIKDDSKTLLQTGISHDNKMDALGFSLEPNPAPAPIRSYPEDRPSQLLHDRPQPLARFHPSTSIVTHNAGHQGSRDSPPDLRGSFNNFIESDHDSAPSPPDMSLQRATSESKALVPVPSMKQDALAVVPLRKSKRSDPAQRRIRRPFTVSEVEALVQAVEKLGTGRWRDVKLRAFDNAKHRTYVDLKVREIMFVIHANL